MKQKVKKRKKWTRCQLLLKYIRKYMHSDNKLVQWIIDHVFIKGIRILAQSIYDDLKGSCEGL